MIISALSRIGTINKILLFHIIINKIILFCCYKLNYFFIKEVNITKSMNKARGGDGIPVELFQTLKDDAVKVLHSICQQIWKTQQWPQDWKRAVFIRIPKKGNAKEC